METNYLQSILNSVHECETDSKVLEFECETCFNYPKKRIFIRQCYESTLDDILDKLINHNYNRFTITGKEGVGKSSFLFYFISKLITDSNYKLGKDIIIIKSNIIYEYIENRFIRSERCNDILPCNSIIINDNLKNINITIRTCDEKIVRKEEEYTFEVYEVEELKEWYKKCIGGKEDDLHNAMKYFGTMPMYINLDYIYTSNGFGNYFDFYKRIIDSAIGNYIENNNENGIENIYNSIENLVLSDSIKKYIYEKIFPPHNYYDYTIFLDKLNLVDDNTIKRNYFKGITLFNISSYADYYNLHENTELKAKNNCYIYNSEYRTNKEIMIIDGSSNYDAVAGNYLIKICYDDNDIGISKNPEDVYKVYIIIL